MMLIVLEMDCKKQTKDLRSGVNYTQTTVFSQIGFLNRCVYLIGDGEISESHFLSSSLILSPP